MRKLLDSFITDNPMVERAKLFNFKKNWIDKLYPIWFSLLVYGFVLIGSVVLLLIAAVPINFIFRSELVNSWITQRPLLDQYLQFSLNLILGFGGIYFLIWLYTHFFEKRSMKSLGWLTSKRNIKFMRGFFFGFLEQLMIFLLILLFTPSTISTNNLIVSGLNAIPWVLLFLIPWGIQASAEELLFQGWALPHLTKKYGVIIGVIGVSILFSSAHLLNPEISVLYILNLALYGIFAALYFLYEKSIYGIAAYHIAWNWSQSHIFGATRFENDPIAMSLFGLNRQGPVYLSGGEYAFAGSSLFETGILILSIIVILLLQYRRLRKEKENGKIR